MTYATLQQLCEAYGFGDIAELLCDENALITEALLRDAVAEQDLASYSSEEQTAVLDALIRANQILNRQSVFIDSKLANNYHLPLPDSARDNTPVVECCLALARAALADDGDNLSETLTAERKHWRNWLNDLAAGRAVLPGVARIASGGARQQRKTAAVSSSVDWSAY